MAKMATAPRRFNHFRTACLAASSRSSSNPMDMCRATVSPEFTDRTGRLALSRYHHTSYRAWREFPGGAALISPGSAEKCGGALTGRFASVPVNP